MNGKKTYEDALKEIKNIKLKFEADKMRQQKAIQTMNFKFDFKQQAFQNVLVEKWKLNLLFLSKRKKK